MRSAFEREYGALAASVGLDANATRELISTYRKTAARLAERASAIQTRESYRDLASYILPAQPITDSDARNIAETFIALRAIDKVDASVRGSDLADCTDDEAVFAQARQRARISPTFTMSPAAIQRLRSLV